MRVQWRIEDVVDGWLGDGNVRGLEEEWRVRLPFEPGFVQGDDAGDGNFADGVRERCLGADRFEEGIPWVEMFSQLSLVLNH